MRVVARMQSTRPRIQWSWLAWTMVVVLTGCPSKKPLAPAGNTTSSQAVSNTAPVDLALARPLLKDWEKPAVAVLLSGEMLGYLEPCGCSLTQSGGLERRGHLQRIITEKGWNLAAFDAGGMLKRTRKQDQIKYESILHGLKELGYSAIAAGNPELRLPPDYLIGQFSEGDGIPLGGLLMGCNVVLFDTPELGVPKAWRVIDAGGTKIGVTAVVGKSAGDEVAPEGVQNQIRVTPAGEALKKVIPEMDAEKPAFKILLSHGSVEEAKTLAKDFPEFAIIVTTGGPEDPADQPLQIGQTYVIQTGHKGKYVGVLGYYPDEKERFRWELVNLDNVRFHDDPRMHDVMKNYQQQLTDLDLVRSPELTIAHPSGHKFVGAETCGQCHTKAYDKWKTSKHAHALESLVRGRKGQEADWISRLHDPECLACHVTGWDPQNVLRYDSGYLEQQASAHLVGQQCENCHGPGEHHARLEAEFRKSQKNVERETLFAARRDVKRNYKTAEQEVCAKCHDHENSPQFKFEKYWDEVKHPWKD